MRVSKAFVVGAGLTLGATAIGTGEAEARFHCSPEGTVTNSQGVTGRDFAGALRAGESGVVHCHGKDVRVNGNNDVPFVGLNGGSDRAPSRSSGSCVVVEGKKYCR